MQVPIGVGTSELNSNSQAGRALDIHCSKTRFQPQSLLTCSCYFQPSVDSLSAFGEVLFKNNKKLSPQVIVLFFPPLHHEVFEPSARLCPLPHPLTPGPPLLVQFGFFPSLF